jgi:GNAT superfamily N-acetyltransferase
MIQDRFRAVPTTLAGPGDAPAVAALIAAAFGPLAVSNWLVTNSSEREEVLRSYFGIFVDHAVNHGEALMTEDRSGVLVSFPRSEPLPDIPEYEQRLARACGRHIDRFRTLDEVFDERHPDEAHQHVAFVAVARSRQGCGIGAALMHHLHDRLERTGTPAYLEAACPRSRAFYLRLGYKDLGEPIVLPHGEPRLWPMWRDPAQNSPA